jgi:phenylpyruvate tautomerase PptA (4-oxalocrotonate tautomerase family)
MPTVLIEVRKAYAPDEEVAIMEAVHGALRQAFKIRPDDRDVRLIAHPPHRFACPREIASPERFTLVTIDAFAGRSLDAKRELYRTIVGNLEALGIPKDHVKIVLHEVPRENWGIRGGQAGSDVELGYKIDV